MDLEFFRKDIPEQRDVINAAKWAKKRGLPNLVGTPEQEDLGEVLRAWYISEMVRFFNEPITPEKFRRSVYHHEHPDATIEEFATETSKQIALIMDHVSRIDDASWWAEARDEHTDVGAVIGKAWDDLSEAK